MCARVCDMINHQYKIPSDNVAQYCADQLPVPRQEVTIDWYLEHMCDSPLFRWIDGQVEFNMDPWRLHYDFPIEPEEAKELGWRIFVQRKDMPNAE